ARAVQAADGSDFRGTPDYFVDVAFPISALIANGVVGSADELAQALFFPATAIAPSHHNKDYLSCPFLPALALTVGASVAPAPAVLQVAGTPEGCDGIDNNCDGQVDEGGDALCDDGVFCNGAETCGGATGCQPGTPPSCDDGNPCTTDACDPTLGCTHTPLPGCPPCTTPADCNDRNACTTDTCNAGICANT